MVSPEPSSIPSTRAWTGKTRSTFALRVGIGADVRYVPNFAAGMAADAGSVARNTSSFRVQPSVNPSTNFDPAPSIVAVKPRPLIVSGRSISNVSR